MMLALNFSNPILISTGDEPDQLEIELLNLPRTGRRLLKLQEGAVILIDIPPQAASSEDSLKLKTRDTQVSAILYITLIVAFTFMVGLSMSMTRVWSLFYGLQILSSLHLLHCVNYPASVSYLLQTVYSISNFKSLLPGSSTQNANSETTSDFFTALFDPRDPFWSLLPALLLTLLFTYSLAQTFP